MVAVRQMSPAGQGGRSPLGAGPWRANAKILDGIGYLDLRSLRVPWEIETAARLNLVSATGGLGELKAVKGWGRMVAYILWIYI